jgi:predicted RNA-binding protein (virulence factor B family)
MLKIGEFNRLTIARRVAIGAFLTDGESDVLLPKKYLPEIIDLGEEIKVFIYLDQQQRPVATTLRPYIRLNDFSYLRVSFVNKFGAFVDWGLEKDLFIPFAEQSQKLELGKRYLVYMFFDQQSNRLVGSTKLHRFLSTDHPSFEENQDVEVIIKNQTDLGYNVIVDKTHLALIYKNEIYEELRIGDKHKAKIKRVRPDGKIDVKITASFLEAKEDFTQTIFRILQSKDGYLPFNDKSSPEDINDIFKMSKKNFKKAIGHLYREKIIDITEDGIKMLTDDNNNQ